jgi:hypothetical protein
MVRYRYPGMAPVSSLRRAVLAGAALLRLPRRRISGHGVYRGTECPRPRNRCPPWLKRQYPQGHSARSTSSLDLTHRTVPGPTWTNHHHQWLDVKNLEAAEQRCDFIAWDSAKPRCDAGHPERCCRLVSQAICSLASASPGLLSNPAPSRSRCAAARRRDTRAGSCRTVRLRHGGRHRCARTYAA